MAVGEWDHRALCPDGACVGVIGSDGHCKVCGRAAINWGNERERGLETGAAADAAPDDDDDDDDDDDSDELAADGADPGGDDAGGDDEDDDDDGEDDEEDDVDDELDPSTPTRLGEAAEWNDRKLCTDGACIGVIGDDGLCKVCGKPARAAKAKAAAPETSAPADDAELNAAADQLAGVAGEDPEAS